MSRFVRFDDYISMHLEVGVVGISVLYGRLLPHDRSARGIAVVERENAG